MSKSWRSPHYERLRGLLVAARLKARLTQVELAERLDKPQSFVSKYESGERGLDVVEFLEVVTLIGADAYAIIAAVIAADDAM